LSSYLRALARAYNYTYENQEHADFWGLREFYSTVRAINTSLNRVRGSGESESVTLDAEMLLWAVLRNYGGRPNEMPRIINGFFRELGLVVPRNWTGIPIENLIKQNLSEPDARHLMLLTRNNAALSLLFDRTIVSQENIEIIFGSDFPLDQNDLQVCLNIQKIKVRLFIQDYSMLASQVFLRRRFVWQRAALWCLFTAKACMSLYMIYSISTT
jgi:hypothetical protein